MSVEALETVRQRLIKCFGNVVQIPEGVSVSWTVPDGSNATLNAFLTPKGNLRIEFTRNLVKKIVRSSDDTAYMQLCSGNIIRICNKPSSQFMYGTWDMSQINHTMELLTETLDILIGPAI